jgi:hypothetical protein
MHLDSPLISHVSFVDLIPCIFLNMHEMNFCSMDLFLWLPKPKLMWYILSRLYLLCTFKLKLIFFFSI